jgi:anti-anti-sigma factor
VAVLVTERPSTGIPVVELCLREAITSAHLPTVRDRVGEVLAVNPRVLALDLSECPAIDAAGIAYLVDLHRRMRSTEGRLELRAPAPPIQRLLRLVRLDRILPVLPASHEVESSEALYTTSENGRPV